MAPSGPGDDAEPNQASVAELVGLGVELFNAGRFFEAHEAWEEVWLEAERPERDFYQGLIQVAAALVHLQRDEYPGLVKLLASGQRRLSGYSSGRHGLDIGGFLSQVVAFEEIVLKHGPGELAEIRRRDLPQIVWTEGSEGIGSR